MIEIVRAIDGPRMDLVFNIRKEVFVIEQNVPPELEYDEFEKEAVHFLAYYNGVPAGTARYRPTPKGIKLERFAVLKAFRSKGIGKALLAAVMDDISTRQDQEIYLHAQVQVIGFYEQHGFAIIGNEFEEAGIKHRKMVYPNSN